jgi:cell division septation protein DedD
VQTLPADPEVATSKQSASGAPHDKSSAAGESAAESKESAPDLTFYKAVKQNPGEETKSAEGLKAPEASANGAAPNAVTSKAQEVPLSAKPTATAKPDSPTSSTPQASPSGTFLVQIAAVTHEEDAAALAGALRRKSYAASVVNNPNGKDKLFHVVLGPYASLQDAEAMKAKLQGEGYSPIVKR